MRKVQLGHFYLHQLYLTSGGQIFSYLNLKLYVTHPEFIVFIELIYLNLGRLIKRS